MNKPKRYFWTIKEASIVREHYPTGGVTACAALLPERSKGSIYQQAYKQGLFYRDNTPRPRKIWSTTDQIDRAVAEVYQRQTGKGEVRQLAKNIGRPYWWVKKRAAALGLANVRLAGNKEPEWTSAEIELLQNNAHKNPDVIAKIFRRHGYARTATAIVVKRKRLGCDTVDVDRYTATQLASEFGVDIHVVTRWIEKEWLKADRRGTKRLPQQGGDQWWIKRRHVRDFIAESVGVIDIRKVNKVWFVDLLVNP